MEIEKIKKVFKNYKNGKSTQDQKYLKLWYDDYPYLDIDDARMRRLLPVPENSMSQRHVRRFNSRFH